MIHPPVLQVLKMPASDISSETSSLQLLIFSDLKNQGK